MWRITGLIQTIQSLCCCWRDNGEKPGIMDMPEIVIQQICDDLEYPEVMALRKTCKAFRHYLLAQTDHGSLRTFTVHTNWLSFNQSTYVTYDCLDNGCRILKSQNEKETTINIEMKRDDVFHADLKFAIVNQPSVMERLCITYDTRLGAEEQSNFIISLVKECLKSRKSPLKVKKLVLAAWTPEKTIDILRYLDPKHLKSLEWENVPCNHPFSMREIVQLEQWKGLKKIKLRRRRLFRSDLKYFLDIGTACFDWCNMGMEELELIKQTCTTSPNFLSYEINLYDTRILAEAIFRFGEHYVNLKIHQCWEWYFSIPGNLEDVVKMELYFTNAYMTFKRIKRTQVPRRAMVRE